MTTPKWTYQCLFINKVSNHRENKQLNTFQVGYRTRKIQ